MTGIGRGRARRRVTSFARGQRIPYRSERSMRLAVFVEGTFVPSREGATRRFVGVLQQLRREGVETIAIHCYRGWSDLQALAAAPFVTYAVDPCSYYDDPGE